MARSVWLFVVVAAVAGCYRVPSEEACTISCDFQGNATCPSGLACGADNVCNAGIQCDQISGVDAPLTDGSDLPPDVDAPEVVPCYGTGLVVYCPTTALPPRDFGPAATAVNINTDDPAPQCTDKIDSGGIELCVIAADSLTVTGVLRATGKRPLVLFGRSGITVTGSIDVSNGGAGTTPTSCTATAGRNQVTMGQASGGGAGGSFTGSGGQGGSANDGMNAFPVIGSTNVTYVRGGCAGGNGGMNYASSGFGMGGLAGGAILLLSDGNITITGTINASGHGGDGAQGAPGALSSAGGGGGGSGGLIFLEANTITLSTTSVLLAEGGGGGGGSTDNQSAGPGASPMLSVPSLQAAGGYKTGLNSGQGGLGSGGLVLYGGVGEDANADKGGGGGGGGGAGAIRLHAANLATAGAAYPPVQ